MKTRLTHVRANVSDIHRAIEWYESILGFECSGADINDKWQYADFADNGGAVFAIAVDENVPSHGRFNFDVDNVDSLWDKLKDKVEIVQEIETMPYGTRKFTIKDLDGNELGFVQQNIIDFTKVTACGECCVGCKKKEDGLCEGCIESDGHCKEWSESKGCPIHKCAKEHNVQFCGICSEFPCEWLPQKVSWNPNIVEDLGNLAKLYGKQSNPTQKEK